MGFVADIFGGGDKPDVKPITEPKKDTDTGLEGRQKRRRAARASIATRRGEFGTGQVARPGLKTTLG